jgi:hypothetical protein
MKATFTLCCLLGYSVFASTQSRNTNSSTKHVVAHGTLTGRAFLITQVGDLRPAILAHVYLFFESSVRPDGKVIEPGPNADDPASILFLKFHNKRLQEETAEIAQEGWSEHVRCMHDLLNYEGAIVETMDTVPERRQWQVVTGQMDETGSFTLSVPQGRWYLVIQGRGGANDAVWVNNNVLVMSAKSTAVKLPSPDVGCLNISSE